MTKVERVRGGGHIVHYVKNGEKFTWPCDAVAVCSGLHVIPNLVSIPGLENVPISFHSSQFKNMTQLGAHQNLLIVGSGETGMDLAYNAVTSDTKSVTLCHRDGKFAMNITTVLSLLNFFRIPRCSKARPRTGLVRDQCQFATSFECSIRCGLRQSLRYSLRTPTPSGLFPVRFTLGILRSLCEMERLVHLRYLCWTGSMDWRPSCGTLPCFKDFLQQVDQGDALPQRSVSHQLAA